MKKEIINIIYSIIWLSFILTLCLFFNSTKPLWLLIVYICDWFLHTDEKKSKKS